MILPHTLNCCNDWEYMTRCIIHHNCWQVICTQLQFHFLPSLPSSINKSIRRNFYVLEFFNSNTYTFLVSADGQEGAFQTYIHAFANNCLRNFLFAVHSHKTQQAQTMMEGRRDADPPIVWTHTWKDVWGTLNGAYWRGRYIRHNASGARVLFPAPFLW